MCIRKVLDDWTVRRVSEHARIPKSTIHDWWNRFQWKGREELVDASKRPHTIHRLPEATVRRVVEIRQQEGWCHEAIAAYRILKRNDLITKPYTPRKQRTFIRYAREHPDSLWQTDITNYGDQYLIAFLDDCSRYLPAATLCPEATTDNVLETLVEALSNGRIPQQILSDHGTEYWSDDNSGRFTTCLQSHGIEHVLGSIGKPTIQGKIERFFQTFQRYYPRFSNIDRFREYYNEKPHEVALKSNL